MDKNPTLKQRIAYIFSYLRLSGVPSTQTNFLCSHWRHGYKSRLKKKLVYRLLQALTHIGCPKVLHAYLSLLSKVDLTGWALAYQAYAWNITCPARNLIVLDDWTGYFSCLVLCKLRDTNHYMYCFKSM